MANNKSFKIKNGLSAGRYLGTNGTETAGSVGYNLADASYDSVSFSIAAEETGVEGLFFKPDGTKMYVTGYGGTEVNEYTLSIAWDITTASSSTSLDVSSKETSPRDISFKSDGTELYVIGTASDDVHQYSLSTAWDISTASFTNSFVLTTSQSSFPRGLTFKPDGTKMYVSSSSPAHNVLQFSLSTAWDVSTASYDNKSYSTGTDNPTGPRFSPDGTTLYTAHNGPDDILEHSLSTAWDISTAALSGVSFNTGSQDIFSAGLFFKTDGTKMYMAGSNTDTVYQYSTVSYTQTLDLSTGTFFSFTPSGATTVSFTNPPASGLAIGFLLEVDNSGEYTITWPSTIKWHGGTAPRSVTKAIYSFITTDGGTTYYGKEAGDVFE